MKNINSREIATLVAALTDFQDKLRVSGAEQVSAEYGDHFDNVAPLEIDEISELIEKINKAKQDKEHYLIRVYGGVGPEINNGPEPLFETILGHARAIQSDDKHDDELYVLVIDKNGRPDVISFSDEDLEPNGSSEPRN